MSYFVFGLNILEVIKASVPLEQEHIVLYSTRGSLGICGRSLAASQPHRRTFHYTHALLAAVVGRHIVEFYALIGYRISTIDIGTPVIQIPYSLAGDHIVIAVLEDGMIGSCDFDIEHTFVLYSSEKRVERVTTGT